MPAIHICPACNRTFNLFRVFESHLRQSRDALCWQVYFEIKRRNGSERRGHNDSDFDGENASENENMSHNPQIASTGSNAEFAGDYFGSAADYVNDPFGQLVEDEEEEDAPGELHHSEQAESEASDGEAEMVAELEAGWEAERGDAPQDEPQLEDDPMDDNLQEEQEAAQDTQATREAERVLIGEGHGIKPKRTIRYSDKYPLKQAGQPLSQQESTDARYAAAVGSGEWAPFKSKIDWEVAHWAKICGPGSTAFSDLLAIDGVSLLSHNTMLWLS